MTETPGRYAEGWRMWVPSVAMMLCSWLSYVDRQILAVLSPLILSETGLTASTYSQVVSSFSIAYMLSNPLWGSVLDRVGLSAGMLAAVSLWTLASTAHAWVGGFLGFAAARALLGSGEGATFPGGLRTALDSLPIDRQSRGLAISYSGGSLGAIVTPLIVVPVALRFGWRAAFLFTGALGLAWLILWWTISRPPYLPAAPRKPTRMIWPNLAERRFWALVGSYGICALPIGPMLYLSPLYLNRAMGLTQSQLGKVLWIPPLGWELGYFFWGWAADRFAPNAVRPVRFFWLLAALSLPLGLVTLAAGPAPVLALFAWTMFVAAGFVVVALRTAARAYPPEQTALVAGIGAGSWSAIVALLMPLLGRWFDQKLYTQTFLLICLLPLAGTLIWMWFSGNQGQRE